MILADDLKNIAKTFSFNLMQTQVNYYQSIVLFAIKKYPIVFKGGTYLWFCHQLPRFSEDLDFTLQEEINITQMKKDIIQTLGFFGAKAEINGKRVIKTEISTSFRIDIEGLFYTGKPQSKIYIHVDLSKREKPILETKSCKLDFNYFQIPEFFVRSLDLKEVLAEKVRAIYTRKKGRDIYDLYFLLSREVVIDFDLINSKLDYYDLKFNTKIFLEKVKDLEKQYTLDVSSLTQTFTRFAEVYKKIKLDFLKG